MSDTTKILRLGMWGAGRQARAAHAASLRHCDFARISALAAAPDGGAEALAAELGAALCAPDELAARDDVDALLVITPPHTHAELVRAALRAGKPVLCELPLAPDPATARALLEEAEAAGVVHASTLPRPLLYGGARVAEVIASGALGPLRSADLTIRLPAAAAAGRGDGYPLLASMAAACLATLFGPGRAVGRDRTRHELDQRCGGGQLEVGLDLALAEASAPEPTGLSLVGELGTLTWSWSVPGHIELCRGGAAEDASMAFEPDLGRAFPFTRDFARAVLDGTRPCPDFADAAATLDLVGGLLAARS
ncbi:MAG: Gfo/Idh/MocA family oxidoreductase [Planctomycetota bacterium]|nr:Gfo/Idh/MocA family oxidoreductase [Planctomycetota bacterium]